MFFVSSTVACPGLLRHFFFHFGARCTHGAERARLVKPSNVRYIQSVHKFDLTGFILHSSEYKMVGGGFSYRRTKRIHLWAAVATANITDYIVHIRAIDCDFCIRSCIECVRAV